MSPALSRRCGRIVPVASLFLAAGLAAALPPVATRAQTAEDSHQVATRDLAGVLTYPQRIALPADALVVVELTAADGAILAATRFATEGAQVPLPFTLIAAPQRDSTLRAGVFSGGRAIWVSDPLPVAGGDGAVDVGDLRLHPFTAMGFATAMRCGDRLLEVGFIDNLARLREGPRVWDLSPVPAASGARFQSADAATVFWSRGNSALVEIEGVALAECAPYPADPVFPLTARGNEPGWALTVAGGRLSLGREGTETTLELPLPEPTGAAGGGWRYDLPEAALAVTITPGPCRDAMTGMPAPYAVEIATADDVLRGCGGAPVALLGGLPWRVVWLDGAVVADDLEITLQFDAANGQVAGRSACNRYVGGFDLTGEALRVGQIAGTMMACADPLMQAERRFLDALPRIDRFDIEGDGTLVLIGADRPLIRARH